MTHRSIAAAALVASLLVAGCAAPSTSGSTGSAASGSRTLTVFAAASLKGPFTTIADGYQAEHPGVRVVASYNGSSTLVDQMKGGAPADVFASADESTMTKARDAGLIAGSPTIFARNVLTLVTPAGNPAHITGLDGSLAGKKLVVCAKGVPCGNATATLASSLGVTLTPVSQEQSVTDVLGKVTSGEADAGIVYVTDAAAAGSRVITVPIPGSDKVVNAYPIAVTRNAKNPQDAVSFVAYVTGDKSRAVLTTNGFATP